MQMSAVLTAMQDAASSRVVQRALPDIVPPGHARFAVRRVSLTTNNLTYALFGERMQYWRFFPSGEDGWGIVPVWGFADVIASRVSELQVGERVYGYWPLAQCADLQPERVSAASFVDATSHRAQLPAVYNRYQRCAADPGHRPQDEDAQALMRPLFATAYLLADFLLASDCFGARRVVLSSASSKTAYAAAWCLGELGRVERVGLTSPANEAFVRHLGVYERVLCYDAIEALDPQVPTVFTDFSGSAAQRARLHNHLGDGLRHSAVIGATQFSEGPRGETLPGPKPTFFFAPEQMRVRAQAWGPAELQRRVTQAQQRFVRRAFAPDDPWVRTIEHQGLAGAPELMRELAQGRVDPALGHVLVL